MVRAGHTEIEALLASTSCTVMKRVWYTIIIPGLVHSRYIARKPAFTLHSALQRRGQVMTPKPPTLRVASAVIYSNRTGTRILQNLTRRPSAADTLIRRAQHSKDETSACRSD
jgi:hypothetical protein